MRQLTYVPVPDLQLAIATTPVLDDSERPLHLSWVDAKLYAARNRLVLLDYGQRRFAQRYFQQCRPDIAANMDQMPEHLDHLIAVPDEKGEYSDRLVPRPSSGRYFLLIVRPNVFVSNGSYRVRADEYELFGGYEDFLTSYPFFDPSLDRRLVPYVMTPTGNFTIPSLFQFPFRLAVPLSGDRVLQEPSCKNDSQPIIPVDSLVSV